MADFQLAVCEGGTGTSVSAKDRAAIALTPYCTSVNLNADLTRTLQNSIFWAPNLRLEMLLEYSLYLSKQTMTS